MTLERRLSRIHFWEWIVDLCGGETLAFAAVAFPGFAVVVRAQVWPESLQAPDGVPLPVGKVFEETVTRHPDHVFPSSIGAGLSKGRPLAKEIGRASCRERV